MKTKLARLVSGFVVMIFCGAAWAGTGAVAQELAVVQALAKILVEESPRPYDYLFHESSFAAKKHVATSMADPDRTQFCGLSREAGMALVKEISFLNMEPLEFDKSVARDVGLGLGQKMFPKFRYLRLSRVVFDAEARLAWLAADLNGESGAVYRLDRINGVWSRTARCGGWVKALD